MAALQSAFQSTRPIFSRADYDAVTAAESRLNGLHDLLDRAANCGHDCQGHRAFVQQYLDRLAAYKREFMSPPPTA